MLFDPAQQKNKFRLLAFDLDGTLTQHKSPLEDEARRTLDALGKKYKLLMVGAGRCERIFSQMGGYPIDIIGNYGMEFSEYDPSSGGLREVFSHIAPCERETMEARITALREQFGFTEFAGDNVEFHASGCVTFPILGTKAQLSDKLVFDPDRSRRRPLLPIVQAANPEYNVFVGGTSSFDMTPREYDKYQALDRYCKEYGYAHDEVLFVGDDFGAGGNDEAVYVSDIAFMPITDYRTFPEFMKQFL
ncbi:MAG: HAD hydrolase family protein [Clostridia bacterium]|nr:HAD hydrolase family protein [Clostridia bacterium]